MLRKLGNEAICKVNGHGYLECSSTSKKKLERVLEKELVLRFKAVSMIVKLRKLVLKMDHGKRAVFNIKQSLNQLSLIHI